MNIFDGDLLPMQVWATRADAKLAQWAKGIVDGRSTGFKTIDPYLRLINSELTLIAARPSMGKTSLAMQIGENVARQLRVEDDPGCVAVYSAEMSGTELVIRMAAALSGVNSHRLRNGGANEDDVYKFRDALYRLKALPIWIDDSSRPSTQRMLDGITQLQETTPVRAMLFDFVELGGDSGANEELRISSIYQHLKGIAKTLDIPVIALSQVGRDVDRQANKMPTLSSLRYSGMAEQVADKVVFIMRPEYYIERGETVDVPEIDRKGIAYVQIAKNRNGPVGLVRMAFVKDRSMFADLKQ